MCGRAATDYASGSFHLSGAGTGERGEGASPPRFAASFLRELRKPRLDVLTTASVKHIPVQHETPSVLSMKGMSLYGWRANRPIVWRTGNGELFSSLLIAILYAICAN